MEKLPNVAASPKSLTASLSDSTDRKAEAARCAKLLLGCYRTGDANDPEIYVGALIVVLCGYPQDVMRDVVNPLYGLPAKQKWLPSIAEVRAACEEIEAPRRRQVERDERIKRQLADREVDRTGRPTYEELIARCAAVGLHIGPKQSAPVDLNAFLEKFKISKEQWDAIPDAPGKN